MQPTTGLTIHRNRIKHQEFPLFVRVLVAVILAAALAAWAPGNVSAAGTGETTLSGCAYSSYWEYFFAHTPNTPNIAQSPCIPGIPPTGGYSSPSLYWEYFFKYDPSGPHIVPPFLLPVTGAGPRTDSSASLVKRTDLGAGYSLLLDGTQGRIVAPARPDTSVKLTDLGVGYVLEETAFGARIIAPSTAFPTLPPSLAVQKTYLGAGYWLENGPDGGRIVQEGSR